MIIQFSTRETVDLHTWSSLLVIKSDACTYRLIADLQWGLLALEACVISEAIAVNKLHEPP